LLAPADLELRTACAILLLEAAYGDAEYAWSEHHAILRALETGFGLGRAETLELLDRAKEIRPPIIKLVDVTELISRRYAPWKRVEIVRLLWRVIHADGAIAEWEEAFADHVAQAVGLSPEEARRAREAD
jgi:uncharacterized tellurite resistance protein B-like protein